MDEVIEMVEEAAENDKESRLNSVIATFVAVTATAMALANIKDDNIVQNMAKAQTKSVDAWAYFQSKSTKQNIAERHCESIELMLATSSGLAPEARTLLETKRKEAFDDVQRYETEKNEIKAEALGHTARYDELNLHDDQLDIAEACLTVAIALFGVTALTRKKWLLVFASGIAVVGFLMLVAGFVGLSTRIGWLAEFLG